MSAKPFVLRCPNGPNMGKYFVRGDYRAIEWTDSKEKAQLLSVRDAYGNIAAMLDMRGEVVVPENAQATESDYEAFATMAAGDMFQNGGKSLIPVIAGGIRRTSEEPLYDHESFHKPNTTGYRSVWEWVLRLAYRGGSLKGDEVPA